MMIVPPFLLYIGSATNPLDIKTSRGVAVFRPQDCVAEYRTDASNLTLGLPRVAIAEAVAAGARTMILGIAAAGGRLTEEMIGNVVAALSAGLDVAAGLHQRLRDEPRIAAAAAAAGRTVHDVRDPPAGLLVGNGRRRPGRRLLTVGTDCAVGKMYTALLLARAMQDRGMPATFRATGQTGILIAGAGIAVDAVVADFISGAVEQLSPARADDGWDVIEGQGSLFHPSFAGVSMGLLHGAQPDALVLCHDIARPHVRGLPHMALPDPARCLAANLDLARLTNPDVRAVGVAINGSGLAPDVARAAALRIGEQLDLPVVDPVRDGVEPILDRLVACAG